MMITSAVETNPLHLKKYGKRVKKTRKGAKGKRVKSALESIKPSNGSNADLTHFFIMISGADGYLKLAAGLFTSVDGRIKVSQ